MKKFIVLILASVAIVASLNVLAQDNDAVKNSPKLTPTEVNWIFINRLKEQLTNVRMEISVCKDTASEKGLWAKNAFIEEELEFSQVISPTEEDWNYSGDEKDLKKGVVKNYNVGENDIAVIYFFNTSCILKPVVITLNPGEEKSLALPKGDYQVSVACGFYNKSFRVKIGGNNWLISSITSASKFGM